jgi:8-oxo-dGTP diphosphatase
LRRESEEDYMETAIGLLSIVDHRVLLVRKRGTWILPGGKPEENENDRMCLRRELEEELPRASCVIGRFFGEFSGTTPHSRKKLTARVYFGTAEGDLAPGAEIEASRYFAFRELESENVSDITREIIESARAIGRLL